MYIEKIYSVVSSSIEYFLLNFFEIQETARLRHSSYVSKEGSTWWKISLASSCMINQIQNLPKVFELLLNEGHLHSYQSATCFESQNKTLEIWINTYFSSAICMPDTKWQLLMTNWSGPFKSACCSLWPEMTHIVNKMLSYLIFLLFDSRANKNTPTKFSIHPIFW